MRNLIWMAISGIIVCSKSRIVLVWTVQPPPCPPYSTARHHRIRLFSFSCQKIRQGGSPSPEKSVRSARRTQFTSSPHTGEDQQKYSKILFSPGIQDQVTSVKMVNLPQVCWILSCTLGFGETALITSADTPLSLLLQICSYTFNIPYKWKSRKTSRQL
jgi:hypothetical protein